MKTDVNGCSTCQKGQENYEIFGTGKTLFQYDYRDEDGELFSTVAPSLEIARDRKADWLVKKLVRLYQEDPNCQPDLWIASTNVNDTEKELFLATVEQTVLGLRIKDLSLRDISEEITDIKRDIAAINDFNKNRINLGELSQLTTFMPSDLPKLKYAIQVLAKEKVRRNVINQ